MRRAFVGLGANLGDPAATLRSAVAALAEVGTVAAVSPAYRTRAIGPPQPDYLNGVVELHTVLPPRGLLRELQAVEAAHGRVRDVRWGPRTLDLDLIWYEGAVSDDRELTLPHPRAHEREFVLRPLADLDPGLELRGRPVRAWLAEAGDQGVARADIDIGAGWRRLPGMSYLEDLEEFDAELELRLKREYATVFGMFRYCVLTAEATYLCNRLQMETAHTAAYPLTRLTMEDVWVWDKNRPSRIIPRAEVHTTQDVTVEELRPEGEIHTTLPPGFELSDE